MAAALDNVARHCAPGTKVWVLVEDEPAAVTVSVRDEGCGIAPDRLDAGRRRRAGSGWPSRSAAGSPTWAARCGSPPRPGEGTEVEMTVPRRRYA